MIVDEIRRAKSAEPFRPFILETSDGRTFLVDEYLHIGVSPSGRNVTVALPEGGFDFLDANVIQGIKILAPTAP